MDVDLDYKIKVLSRDLEMICEECKKCDNYKVCENGCFGNTEPCKYLLITCQEVDDEPKPNYWGEY